MTCTNVKLTIVTSLAVTVFVMGNVVNAQTIRYEDGFASGIENLRVNNLCYDVKFVDGSYVSTFADSSPTFLNRPGDANAAANEIRDVLNDTRLVPEINKSDNEVLWIPNERVTRITFQAAQVGHDKSTEPWQRYGDFQGQVAKDFEPWDFAVFEEGPSVIYAANTGVATGIHNINIDGTCIDVRFADGSYNEVFANHAPRYLGLEKRANNAANVMRDILNSESDVPEINASDNEVLWVPTDRTRTEFEAEQLGHDTSVYPWRRYGDFQGSVATANAAWDFAVFEQSLDCNRDGVVDVNDMNCACATKGMGEEILEAIDSMPGDLDGNGKVTFADFLKLSGNFGENGQYTDGDLNCDGKVGFGDFLKLSANFGGGRVVPEGLDIATIPEPSAATLASIMLPAVLLTLRRRRS